jgi:hypothetical protein
VVLGFELPLSREPHLLLRLSCPQKLALLGNCTNTRFADFDGKGRVNVKGESKISEYLAIENIVSVVGTILAEISRYLDFHHHKSVNF